MNQGKIDSLKKEILSKPHDPAIDSLIVAYDSTISLYQRQLIATAELAAAAMANSAKKDTLITGYTQMIDGLNKELDRWTKKNTRRFDIGSGAIGVVIGAAIVTLAVVAK